MESMKAKMSVTVEKELVAWIGDQVKTQRFRNRSHEVEGALMRFRESEKEGMSHE